MQWIGGLEYLIGFAERDAEGTPRYTPLWSFESQRRAARLRAADGGDRVASGAASGDARLSLRPVRNDGAESGSPGVMRRRSIRSTLSSAERVLVDLYAPFAKGFRASVESYSIKRIEALYGFERKRPSARCECVPLRVRDMARAPRAASRKRRYTARRNARRDPRVQRGRLPLDAASSRLARSATRGSRREKRNAIAAPAARCERARAKRWPISVERVRAVMRALLERDAGRRVDA